MTPLFAKLNLKNQRTILVIDSPSSFQPELARLGGVAVQRDVAAVRTVAFAIVFVQTLTQVASAASAILPKAAGDAVIWFAYPKGTSKRFRCEFNRDTGWDAIRRAGFDTVRQVAIDEDWSALRFRRIEYIKAVTSAAPPAGKTLRKRT